MYFLINLKTRISPQALRDTAFELAEQRYFTIYPPHQLLNIQYVVTEIGSVWFDKNHLSQLEQDWLKRTPHSFGTACHKATQEVLHFFLPPEHRSRLRGVAGNVQKVEVVRDSLVA